MPTAAYMREYRAKKRRDEEMERKRLELSGVKSKKQKKTRKPVKTPVKTTVSKPKKIIGRKGGPTSKDAAITDNFNPDKTIKPSKKDLKKAKEILDVTADNDTLQDVNAMLEDMRHVYGKAGGRDKLTKMVKKDDKQFMMLAKDLMKVEVALMSAKIRKEGTATGGGGGGQQNFFVVLKGLEEEQPLMKELAGDGMVNVTQIKDAIDPSKKARARLAEPVFDPTAAPTEIIDVSAGEEEDDDWMS